jgi:divalent metal cation (Fe/Co/Zn/Cd) transporter
MLPVSHVQAPAPSVGDTRATLVRRGLWLNYITIGYNTMEAVVSIVAGVLAGSVALVGFGIDSAIEVTAAGAARWRLHADIRPDHRERVERISVRIIGWSFLALAVYVVADSASTLWQHEKPDTSIAGLGILVASVIVMPLLARAKRRVAFEMGSRTLAADAKQTSLCAYLSTIGLAGVALNAVFGWWWADPIAALVMVPIIAKEGVEGVRGEDHCTDCVQ